MKQIFKIVLVFNFFLLGSCADDAILTQLCVHRYVPDKKGNGQSNEPKIIGIQTDRKPGADQPDKPKPPPKN